MRLSQSLALDLGTANSASLRCGQKVEDIRHLRSVVAWDRGDHHDIVAIGKNAYDMIGREPDGIEVEKAVRRGNPSDPDAVLAVMNELCRASQLSERLTKAMRSVTPGVFYTRPTIVMGVPRNSSELHQIVYRDLIKRKFNATPVLMYEQVLDVIGEDLALTPTANCKKAGILGDIGGGTTDVAVFGPEGFSYTHSHDIGGDRLDLEIVHGFRTRNVNKDDSRLGPARIGLRTAERVKIELASAMPPTEELTMEVRGKSPDGRPIELLVTNFEVYNWLHASYQEIADDINQDLARLEEGETHAEIKETGIFLTGGTAGTKKIAEFLREETGLVVRVSANPEASVVLGAAKVLENLKYYKKFDLVPLLR